MMGKSISRPTFSDVTHTLVVVTPSRLFSFSAVTTSNLRRRNLPRGFSVTYATASMSTILRTVPHRRSCLTPLHTLPTTAIRARSGPTATSVRSLATGPTPVTTTRPFKDFFFFPLFLQTLVRTITIFAHIELRCASGVLVHACACILCACFCQASLLSAPPLKHFL